MTVYTVHADALFDPDKPILGSTHLEARDNLLATMEGDTDAPRLQLKGIQPLVVGDTVRSKTVSGSLASSEVTSATFAFIQTGSIRCKTSGSAGGGGWAVSRKRNGASATMASGTGPTSSTDVIVQPGDRITITYTNGSGAQVVTCSFCTSGVDLWPGSEAILEGNNV